MRTFKLVLLSFPLLALFACFAFGQDPGMQAAQMAAQQSMQAAQQANDQAIRDMQQASQNAQQAMQNAQQASDTTWQCAGCFARMPAFSVKPGTYSTPVTVKIKDRTRGAIIYYTTDGWTPTENSARYRGPITIATTTSLQATAISRHGGRSRIATALYTLRGTAPALQPAQFPNVTSPRATPATAINEHPTSVDGKFLLAHGTPVPLIFASSVTSKTADVGDQINLTLAEDLKVGDVIVAKKGTPASGTVTEVDKNGMGGAPGEIFFEADSLQIDGSLVKLYGGAAKEGQDKVGKAVGLMFVPVVPVGIFVHGKNAEIKPGALFTAFVDADSLLPPAN
jgi:hypothetical protein